MAPCFKQPAALSSSYVCADCSYLILLGPYDGMMCELSLTAAQAHSSPSLSETDKVPSSSSSFFPLRFTETRRGWLTYIYIFSHMRLLSWLLFSNSEISNINTDRLSHPLSLPIFLLVPEKTFEVEMFTLGART